MARQAPTVARNGRNCMCGLFQKKGSVEHGREYVPGLNRMVSYSITRPKPEDVAKNVSIAGEPCLLTTHGKAVGGKVHVMWKVDTAEVKVGILGADDGEKETKEEGVLDGEPPDTDCGSDVEAAKAAIVTTNRTCSREFFEVGHERIHPTALPKPAYVDEQTIEYFSVTHQRWMSGSICNETCFRGEVDSKQSVCQNVILAHGHQARADISLDLIRAPFRAGDLVEFLSGGSRFPATISKEQQSAPVFPSLLGYRVVVEGSKELIDHVPPEMLRRRFPSCMLVERYYGPDVGWVAAKVAHTSSADGCSVAPWSDLTVTDTRPLAQTQPSELGLWTSVPVCAVDDKECEFPEFVPSYILRVPSSCKLSL